MRILDSFKEHKLKSILLIVFALILFMMLFLYSNKVAPISWRLFGVVNTEIGVALKGGDAVTYFTLGKYIPGDKNISYETKDAIWQFSSEANKQLFIASPNKYMPQYGGFCAFAISTGVTADANPDNWTIQNGKLYLFNGEQPKFDWMNEISNGVISISDKNWSTRF